MSRAESVEISLTMHPTRGMGLTRGIHGQGGRGETWRSLLFSLYNFRIEYLCETA